MNWISVKDQLPPENCGFILVTNNIDARSAFGNMSHIWMSLMLHKQDDGRFSAFAHPGFSRVESITHWCLAAPAVANGEAEDERAKFEKHYGPKDGFAWRTADDKYKSAALQMAWELWQAAIASAHQAAPKQSLTDEDIRTAALAFGVATGRAVIDGRCMVATGEGDKEIISFARAIEAAAAPNALLVAALKKAREDINWMLNSQQFLNGHVFDYIDAALASIPTVPEKK